MHHLWIFKQEICVFIEIFKKSQQALKIEYRNYRRGACTNINAPICLLSGLQTGAFGITATIAGKKVISVLLHLLHTALYKFGERSAFEHALR